jgi:GTP-binding protein
VLPVIALVGRPNVGKSTLFNVLTGTRDAIVANLEGLTRDRRYGRADRHGHEFLVVDTGGLTSNAEGIEALMAQQVRAAIAESDVLLFMVDGRVGVTPEDQRIGAELRAIGKPVVIVVNKTDGLDERVVSAEFFSLGFATIASIAAAHRRGIQLLVEQVVEQLPVSPVDTDQEPEEEPSGTKLAIIGRPNVGKSTLVNRLLGEERVLAYDQPGTTRDTVHIPWQHGDKDYVLIDTAGVRRRSKVHEAVEKFSVIKAIQAIQEANVSIVMIGLSADDRARTKASLDRKLRFVSYAQVVFVSALHGSGLGELMDAVERAFESANMQVGSSQMTQILERASERHQPPMVQGRTPKLRYAHLGGQNPLRVVIHGSRTKTIPEAYRRYLANFFREQLDLKGTPVRLDFRDGTNPYSGRKNVLTRRQLAKRKRLKNFTKRKN